MFLFFDGVGVVVIVLVLSGVFVFEGVVRSGCILVRGFDIEGVVLFFSLICVGKGDMSDIMFVKIRLMVLLFRNLIKILCIMCLCFLCFCFLVFWFFFWISSCFVF